MASADARILDTILDADTNLVFPSRWKALTGVLLFVPGQDRMRRTRDAHRGLL